MNNCNGDYFTYNGVSSEIYGLVIASIDTEINQEFGGSFEIRTYQNIKQPRNVIQNINYNKVFEYEIEFISLEHKLDDNINQITNWLLNRNTYGKFALSSWENGVYINCIFTESEKIKMYGEEGYGIYGIKAKLMADSVFRWTTATATYTNDQLVDTITLNNKTDVRGYTYPKLVIKTGLNGGDITIQNISDNNRLVTISDTLANDTITITSFPRTITSYLNDNKILVYQSFNKKFPRLLQGDNRIGIVGDIASLTFEYEIGKVVV